MIKKVYLTLALCAATLVLHGGNLLENHDFSRRFGTALTDWNTNTFAIPGAITIIDNGGINGKTAVKVDYSKTVAFGQGGLRLIPNERYKVGAYIRANNFSATRSGIGIANWLWMSEQGINPIPANTNGKWIKVEKEIVCPPPAAKSGDYRYNAEIYSFVIYAVGSKGTLEISEPFLIPVSPKAKARSVKLYPFSQATAIVPISPKLTRIPERDAVFDLFHAHIASGTIKVHVGGVSASGKLSGHRCKVSLPKIPVGEHIMYLSLTAGGKVVAQTEYPVIVVPVFMETPSRRLNNLVREFCNTKPADGKFILTLNRPEWIFLATDGQKLTIDGKNIAMRTYRNMGEHMTQLAAGEHTITVQPGKTLICRKMPEVLIYAFRAAAKTDFATGEMDLDFWTKSLLHSVNTLNFDSYYSPNTQAKRDSEKVLRRLGYNLIGSGGFHARKWSDPIAMLRDIDIDFASIHFNSRTLDELHTGSHYARIAALTDVLWLHQKSSQLLYTWCEWGAPMYDPHTHTEFISAQSNVSRGRGKYLPECYIRTYDTIENQTKENHFYRNQIAATSKFYPGVANHLIMVSGGYLLPSEIFQAPYPQSDPKYAQDLFYHMCATDPVFADLYGIGMYSVQSMDEEHIRYLGALFRHYAIEGKTTLLADRYGYTFNLPHLQNGDFVDGLKSWQVKGAVKASDIPGYGVHQGRSWCWRNKTIGNQVAEFYPEAGASASISQRAVKLVPGKVYSLTYISAFKDEAAAKRKRSSTEHIKAVFGDKSVTILDHHVYNSSRAFAVHKIIFRAEKESFDLTFTVTGGKPVVLNYIALRPYFTE